MLLTARGPSYRITIFKEKTTFNTLCYANNPYLEFFHQVQENVKVVIKGLVPVVEQIVAFLTQVVVQRVEAGGVCVDAFYGAGF